MRTPKLKDRVKCPADRGMPEFWANVEAVGTTVYTNIHGVKYVWMHMRDLTRYHRTASVWPSHRLGYTLDRLH